MRPLIYTHIYIYVKDSCEFGRLNLLSCDCQGSTAEGMKISIDMTGFGGLSVVRSSGAGFHMTAEEIRQSEYKLKQEAQHEAQFEKQVGQPSGAVHLSCSMVRR